MITLNPIINPHQKRKDGTWQVKVRVIYKRQNAYIQTPHMLVKEQMTKNFTIKDSFVDLDVQEDLMKMRRIVAKDFTILQSMSAKEIANHIYQAVYSPVSDESLNYPEFANSIITKKKKNGSSNYRNYVLSLNRLIQFVGHTHFTFNDITYDFLTRFDEWLENDGTGPRGRRLYISNMRTIFKAAKKKFNNESKDKILIKRDPFAQFEYPHYSKPPKRALTIDQIVRIRDVELNRETLQMARDLFMLSFYTVGMNSIDLYKLDALHNNRIEYNRSKTYRRRDDHAFISIKIEPEAWPLINKYKSKGLDTYFMFSAKYSTSDSFNTYMNKYLKVIGKMVGVTNLQFYSARHTWATFLVNKCGRSEEDAAFCLNHVSEHPVTNGYVGVDFTRIDRFNREVLDCVKREGD